MRRLGERETGGSEREGECQWSPTECCQSVAGSSDSHNPV